MGDENTAPLCDIVLEGGVTSALIYTGLIARLSRHYRLKRLGGTSSGAVAAAAGAIAQRARIEGLKKNFMGQQLAVDPDAAFKALRDFPRKLAKTDARGRTVLFRLFQAQQSTCRGYRIVAAFLQHGGPGRRFAGAGYVVAATIRNFPLAAALGALPGIWFVAVALHSMWQRCVVDPANGVSVVLGLLLAVGLGLLVAVLRALWHTLHGMLGNHYGLCNGMTGVDGGDDTPLTLQLHQFFNGLLGRNGPLDKPVVFAELWGADALNGGEREIDLQVITTAVNLRRPFRLPNDPGVDPLSAFFYDRKEWKELFPTAVMVWLEAHRRLADGPPVTNEHGVELWALPPPSLWPVLVAVRLSLSFPGLLSAVPMYTLEGRSDVKPGARARARTQRAHVSEETRFVAHKVYFSDGGITSNCPVQLFDAPLPRHPTFGVKLDTPESGEGGRHRIFLPGDEAQAPPRVQPFDTRCALSAAWDFVAGIAGTSLDWRDRLQRELPGYRERVVIVGLRPEEGGLNLAMTPKTIGRVAALGSRAALRLQQAFEGPRTAGRSNSWDRHRWLRLRSTLAAAQRYAAEIQKVEAPGDHLYDDMLNLRPTLEPGFVDRAAVVQAKALLDGLSQLAAGDSASPARDLADNAPEPAPRLRMSSPW